MLGENEACATVSPYLYILPYPPLPDFRELKTNLNKKTEQNMLLLFLRKKERILSVCLSVCLSLCLCGWVGVSLRALIKSLSTSVSAFNFAFKLSLPDNYLKKSTS